MPIHGYNTQRGYMKKLNILFTDCHDKACHGLSGMNMNSKSEIARAAMSAGLSMVYAARNSMTDREFYEYVMDYQDIDESIKQFIKESKNA